MPTLTDADARSAISDLPGWEVADGHLAREYVLKSFLEAIAFINRIAERAEAADHHPALEISYDHVRVRLRTHSADGITHRDVALAREIEATAGTLP